MWVSQDSTQALFVEQNLDLIVSLADRGLVMDKGRVIARLDAGDPFPVAVKRFLAL